MKLAFPTRVFKAVDWTLYIIPILLSIGSLATLYSITIGSPNVDLTWRQLLWIGFGLIVMVLLSRYDYRALKYLSPVFYFICIFLLILVTIIGSVQLGAKRWIDLGFFQLQPSELTKLATVMLLGGLFSNWDKIDLRRIAIWLGVVGIPLILVILQPDFGTSMIILGVGLIMLTFSKVSRKVLGVIYGVLIALAPVSWFLLHDYQRQRLLIFLDPNRDPFGAGYNVLQSLITVGSGGLFGRGLGHGPQSQLNFLPIAHTDFIFAGWAEATGLVGSVILILLFVLLIFKALNIAKRSQDAFGLYLGLGIAIIFFLQMIINIGMNLGVLPVTGVPLPFFSYGGTTILVNFAAIGLLQSIHLRHHKIVF